LHFSEGASILGAIVNMRSAAGSLTIAVLILVVAGRGERLFAQNLLPNPHFDTDTTPWGTGFAYCCWDGANDAEGSPGSGSARGAFSTAEVVGEEAVVGVCMPAVAATTYTFGGKVLIPTQATAGTATINLGFYTTSNCSTGQLGTTTTLTLNQGAGWQSVSTSATAPAGSTYLYLFTAIEQSATTGSVAANFDDLLLETGPAEPLNIAASFTPPTITVGSTTTLQLTITNPNSAGSSGGIAITDTLPAGLVVATPNGLVNGCGGNATATAGGSVVSLANGSLAGGGSCDLTVTVLAQNLGAYTDTTSAVTSIEGGSGNTATAGLDVTAVPIAAVPTLAPWGLVLLALMVGTLGVVAAKRHSH
jgi:hypothetical protein